MAFNSGIGVPHVTRTMRVVRVMTLTGPRPLIGQPQQPSGSPGHLDRPVARSAFRGVRAEQAAGFLSPPILSREIVGQSELHRRNSVCEVPQSVSVIHDDKERHTLGYFADKAHFRAVLVRQVDIDRLGQKLGIGVSDHKGMDRAIEAAIDKVCGMKASDTRDKAGNLGTDFASEGEFVDG